MEDCVSKPVRLFVYSHRTDRCREVTIIPNATWGGEGILGCDIGFGFLHRIPSQPYSTAETKENSTQPIANNQQLTQPSFSTLQPPVVDKSQIKIPTPMMVPSSSMASLPSISSSNLPGLGVSKVTLEETDHHNHQQFTSTTLVAPQ